MRAASPGLRQAPWSAHSLALAIPALALGGAYYTQYMWGLFPCEMCWWQRYPHFAGLGLALLGLAIPPQRLWVMLAGLALVASGLIGGFHAGVEYGWWDGLTRCAGAAGGGDPLEAIMNAPLIRCDVAAWTLGGISLAGLNFLLSTLGGLAVLWLAARKPSA